MTVFAEKYYLQQNFNKLIASSAVIDEIEFHSCQFKLCKFNETQFNKCKFTECDFEDCDLSLVKFKGCKFSESSFKDCNLAGINWTQVHWPSVKLSSPLYFYNCNLSHGSFYSLDLADLVIEQCKVHEVDFRDSNLNHASFVGSDLHGSLFIKTSLLHADFTNAINYIIDIRQNNITKARFSFPDAIALLKCLDIHLIGYDD
ncbi:Uncharacterized protein conserved in bacteria [Legionella lansingensis]|uniref:Pentapeptide repeats (8 copies) n=1 Tax=Legionella lansingensis TaxID=45067 RepID=A0A0W0VGL4_9GAMM|nr:pentapeptide repeat-containing protein [Legionella lansingensis]KTD19308.1 Pentapeptide repeats (8 copies) [Legionella lansingensis]SNV50440.1 Uncharacterized protein conserved in bacteria [Legionella lansingensis]